MDESWCICRALVHSGGSYKIEKIRVRIRDQIISEITPTNEGRDDYPGYVFVPPLCNMHAHLGESLYRDINGNQWTLKRYLDYTSERNKAIPDGMQQITWDQSADETIKEMNRHGTTLFCAGRSAGPAKRFHELTMAGYPIMNSEKIIAYKKRGIQGFTQYVSENQGDRISIGVFLHSLYANYRSSLDLAEECMSCGADFITVHISEDEESRKKEIERFGESPVRILKQYGLLTDKTILIHCGYADAVDLKMIAESGAAIVICPISNMFLNTRMPDISVLNDLGIRWCIATDGWATGRTLSLVEQALYLQQKQPGVSPIRLFECITSIPGALFQSKLYTGRIEKGIENRLLQVPYSGNSAEELICMIMTGGHPMNLIALSGGSEKRTL